MNFDPPSDFKYEIVEGLIVHVPMANSEHDRLRDEINRFLDHMFCDESKDVVCVSATENTVQTVPLSSVRSLSSSGVRPSSGTGASSSFTPVTEQRKRVFNCRQANVAANVNNTAHRRSSSGTASPTPSNFSEEVRKRTKDHEFAGAETRIQYTIENPPDLVIEVTSESNKEDTYVSKWQEYALTGVKTYVIVDIAPTNTKKRSVIVETFRERKHREGWKTSTTGHPETGPESPPTDLSNHVTCYYYKKFTGEMKIDVTPFKQFEVTAKELLSVESMRKRARELQVLPKKRADSEQKRADSLQKKAEAAQKEIEEAKKALRLSEAPERGGRQEDSTTNIFKKNTRNPGVSANELEKKDAKEQERKEAQLQGGTKRRRETVIEGAKGKEQRLNDIQMHRLAKGSRPSSPKKKKNKL